MLIIVFTGFVIFLSSIFYFITKNAIQNGSETPIKDFVVSPKQEQTNPGLPVRLNIPKINVDAVIEYVGLTPNGEMDVPKGPAEVVWFELGQRPGENGSAVIAGHYGPWKSGARSVFENLTELRKGDKVYVEDDKGETISFVVREIRRYDPEADASGVFSSNDGKAHLNLITCDGVWDNVSKSYPERLVVFTDKE